MPALRGAPEWVGVQSQGRCRNGFRRVVHVDIRRLVSRRFDSAQSTSFWREPHTARGFPRAPSIMGGEAGRSLMDGAGRILRKRAAISFETFRAQASMRTATRVVFVVVMPRGRRCNHATASAPRPDVSETRIDKSLRPHTSCSATRARSIDQAPGASGTSRSPMRSMQDVRRILRRAGQRSMRHWSWAGWRGPQFAHVLPALTDGSAARILAATASPISCLSEAWARPDRKNGSAMQDCPHPSPLPQAGEGAMRRSRLGAAPCTTQSRLAGPATAAARVGGQIPICRHIPAQGAQNSREIAAGSDISYTAW